MVTLKLQFSDDGVVKVDHQIPFDIITSEEDIEDVGFPSNIATRVVLRIPASRLDDLRNFQKLMQTIQKTGANASASMGVFCPL